jgi:hypothetical protein
MTNLKLDIGIFEEAEPDLTLADLEVGDCFITHDEPEILKTLTWRSKGTTVIAAYTKPTSGRPMATSVADAMRVVKFEEVLIRAGNAISRRQAPVFTEETTKPIEGTSLPQVVEKSLKWYQRFIVLVRNWFKI